MPIKQRLQTGARQRVRVTWNGVAKYDEVIVSPSTALIDTEIIFSGTMGAEGRIKVEFFMPEFWPRQSASLRSTM